MQDLENYIQGLYNGELDKNELEDACQNLLRFFELLYKIGSTASNKEKYNGKQN